MQQAAPGFNQALNVAGRWALGWATAHLFHALLLGRLRALSWVLCLDGWVPFAALSYSMYLLQKIPLTLIPDWGSAGVTTMWAAWSTLIVGSILVTAASVLLSVPCYVLVERPCSLLWPRRR